VLSNIGGNSWSQRGLLRFINPSERIELGSLDEENGTLDHVMPAATQHARALKRPRLFEGLQVRKEIIDLIGFELKGWHRGMPSVNTFGKCLRESFDWIAMMQLSKLGVRF
jgi:hypothetical protein